MRLRFCACPFTFITLLVLLCGLPLHAAQQDTPKLTTRVGSLICTWKETEVSVWTSPGGQPIASLDCNAKVTLLAEVGSWYRVQLKDGKVGYLARLIVSIEGQNAFSEEHPSFTSSPSAPQQTQRTGFPSDARVASYLPELRISNFMLQPRSKIEVVLGKPVKQYECNDTAGQQYEYSDGSYLCVEHGRVILLSYNLHRIPSNVDEALGAVGLHTVVKPFTPYDSINIWSAERGNPIIVGTILAHQVTAFVGRVNRVEVDMTGAAASSAPSNTPEATKQTRPETAAAKKVQEFVGARIAYAGFLNAFFQREGRLIHVEAAGDNQQTLDVYSGLIADGTYTLVAARETVNSSEAITALRLCRFTKVIIRGSHYSEAYAVN